MESNQIQETKKRTIGAMKAGELAWKFKSKKDICVYLDQHRKSIVFCLLTCLQSSTTSLTKGSSTKIS